MVLLNIAGNNLVHANLAMRYGEMIVFVLVKMVEKIISSLWC